MFALNRVAEGQSVRQVVAMLETRLREALIPTARAEAEWLLADLLRTGRTELYLRGSPLDSQIVDAAVGLLERRLHGESLQQVLGSAEFFGHRLSVRPEVFVPRPETEALAEQAIGVLGRRLRQGMAFPRVLDLGTGTGNLAITIAKAVPTCVVVAVELSWEALSVARANVRAHGLDERVRIVQADWTAGISGSWEVIVSNPPYVATSDVERLLAAGLGDPRLSLDGGPDGMAFARRLLEEAPQLLARHGALVMECAESQVEVLARLAQAQSWANRIQLFDDLAGRPRGLVIEAKG